MFFNAARSASFSLILSHFKAFCFSSHSSSRSAFDHGFCFQFQERRRRRRQACKSGLHREMNKKKLAAKDEKAGESNLAVSPVSPSPPCFTSRSSFFPHQHTAAALITSLLEEKSISNPFKYLEINARVCACARVPVCAPCLRNVCCSVDGVRFSAGVYELARR